jgi:hypothetical protein
MDEQVEHNTNVTLSLTPRFGEQRMGETRNCFNSFSASADVYLYNICALDHKLTNQRAAEGNC